MIQTYLLVHGYVYVLLTVCLGVVLYLRLAFKLIGDNRKRIPRNQVHKQFYKREVKSRYLLRRHRLLIFGGITYFKIMGLIVHFFNKNKNNKTSLITLQTTYILDNYIMFVKIYITGKNQIRGSLPDDSQHGPLFLQLTFNR